MEWLVVRLLDFCYFGAVSCLFHGWKVSDGGGVGYPSAGQSAIGVPMKRVRQWLFPYGLILEDIRKIIFPITLFQNAFESSIALRCIFLQVFLVVWDLNGIALGSIHITVDLFLKNCVSKLGWNFVEIKNGGVIGLYFYTVVIDLLIRLKFVIQQFYSFFVVVVVMYFSHGFQVLFGLGLRGHVSFSR